MQNVAISRRKTCFNISFSLSRMISARASWPGNGRICSRGNFFPSLHRKCSFLLLLPPLLRDAIKKKRDFSLFSLSLSLNEVCPFAIKVFRKKRLRQKDGQTCEEISGQSHKVSSFINWDSTRVLVNGHRTSKPMNGHAYLL